jgi:hypothetical protein
MTHINNQKQLSSLFFFVFFFMPLFLTDLEELKELGIGGENCRITQLH